MQDQSRGHLVQEDVGSRAVGHLAAGQQEGDGAAEPVGQGVYLGGASTS